MTSDKDDLKGDLNKIWKTWKDKNFNNEGNKFKDNEEKMGFILNKMLPKVEAYIDKHKKKNNNKAKYNNGKKRKRRGCCSSCFG